MYWGVRRYSSWLGVTDRESVLFADYVVVHLTHAKSASRCSPLSASYWRAGDRGLAAGKEHGGERL